MLGLLIAARYFELTSSTIALVTIILYRLFQRVKIFQQSYQQFNKSVPGYYSINKEVNKSDSIDDVDTIISYIERLSELNKNGILSYKEFEKKKKDLLKKI